MTEQQQEAWIYTWERIALVQTILNGGAAARSGLGLPTWLERPLKTP